MTTKRSQASNIEELLIDPAGSAMNELHSLFNTTPTRRESAVDAMSKKVMAGSRPIVAKGFPRQPGWLDSKRSA